MQLRGARRRRGVDRGFVLSDHADWAGLNAAIDATGASRVIVTHGQVAIMVRWLIERGLSAQAFETEFDNAGENDVVAADPLGATDADASSTSGSGALPETSGAADAPYADALGAIDADGSTTSGTDAPSATRGSPDA